MGSKLGALKVAAKRIGISFEEYQDKLEAGLKWCAYCRSWKPREQFYPDRSRGDGLSARCIDCSRARSNKKRIGSPPSKKIQSQIKGKMALKFRVGFD